MPPPQYATHEHMLKRYDARLLAQAVSDSGADGTVNGSNAILEAALFGASADVQSYALRGQQYSAEDLNDLYAAEDWTLIGCVCDRALVLLYQRRGAQLPEAVKEITQASLRTLADLRSGDRVFGGSSGQQAAGRPATSIVSSSARANSGLASDSPFYKRRLDRAV